MQDVKILAKMIDCEKNLFKWLGELSKAADCGSLFSNTAVGSSLPQSSEPSRPFS